MKIEFNTVFTETESIKFSEYALRYCSPEYNKGVKKSIIIMIILAIVCAINGIILEIYSITGCAIFALVLYIVSIIIRKKASPQATHKINVVGCPFDVTFGFYDEYFYQKVQNNMIIEEISERYEFLDYVVETPEYFLLLNKRRRGCIFHKGYLNCNDVATLSAFFKTRFPEIYRYEKG